MEAAWNSDCRSAACRSKAIRELAALADDGGFHYLTVPDHFVLEEPGSGLDVTKPSFEAIAVLGALAASTRRAKIGGMVLCNMFRHPALTAQAVSTLDHLSGGRAFLGIGAGWTRAEFDMMGIDYPDVKVRLRMLDEALAGDQASVDERARDVRRASTTA